MFCDISDAVHINVPLCTPEEAYLFLIERLLGSTVYRLPISIITITVLLDIR